MAMKKKPVTGMKDILPAEMQLRDYVTGLIKDTYKSFGFSPIETPCVEHIENLCSKQGGENEKLIFKIMKRGEKLNLETAESEADLTDSGLRYDLTVPLSRFYANNANSLPAPFKALQIGSVWRADRPQRGRFRQFVQCDIDILGEPTALAEIELILATTTLLGKLNFSGFKVRINERRILKAMAERCGFPEEQYDLVFIILDKMDKIGWNGVKAELLEAGFAADSVERYVAMFGEMEQAEDPLSYLEEALAGSLEDGVIDNLRMIRESVEAVAASRFELVFDPTLVRGMSYYTGTIFEIEMAEFGSSVAGGGRYDKMIGKFTGRDTPACGFSIGFERIITILLEQGFRIPGEAGKKAFLIEKNMPADKLCEVLKTASAEREAGNQVLVTMMNKNKKFQKEQLEKEGYTEFKEFFVR
ncbi:MAG: histidine--tRNA ligase [Lachnospiraceae bacterium]|nr:histidine--tRNA ligase [Lachnospiraceae bacterium]